MFNSLHNSLQRLGGELRWGLSGVAPQSGAWSNRDEGFEEQVFLQG